MGELGWAAQDMLDRVLDGELAPDAEVQKLVREVVAALPGLVMSYRRAEGLDVEQARQLTNRCFALANTAGEDLAKALHAADLAPARPAARATQPQTLSH